MPRVALAVAAVLALAAAPAGAGEWIAGDLHVHTTYSHDSYGGPGDDNTGIDEANTLGQSVTEDFAVAAARGLDFLAITDHNDVRSQSDPGFGAFGVLAVPGYENSLHGHAQMLGARRIYDSGDESAAAVSAMAAALHADGGVFQANHPAGPLWEYGYDVPVDTVEVWNLPWYYKPPLPAASDNEAALRYWQGWLDRGAHVAATGGSDSHWKATLAAQGPGQPTTWVRVERRTVDGLLAGLRAGHTSISAEPPGLGAARVLLRGRDHAIAGDTIPAGSRLRVRVRNAPGATLRVIGDSGRVLLEAPVTSTRFRAVLRAPGDVGYAFAEVRAPDPVGMLALSSAIYVAG